MERLIKNPRGPESPDAPVYPARARDAARACSALPNRCDTAPLRGQEIQHICLTTHPSSSRAVSCCQTWPSFFCFLCCIVGAADPL